MKNLFLLITVIFLCFISYAQKISKIDPVLQEEMLRKYQGELIKINIILKAQYDPIELRSKVEMYLSKEAKRAFVVNELKRYANETQQEVMRYLNLFVANNSVTDISQFWIYNGIHCSATQEVIKTLSDLDDILIIGFDKLENLLPEKENPRPADPSKEIPYNVTQVNAHLVWELGYTGEGVIVAVLDTGVNFNHNDLKTHLWEHPDYPNHGWNFVSNNNYPIDNHDYQGSGGHGTHCAGTIAGNGASGSQTGMAPNATIMALKVLNSRAEGEPSKVFAALEFGIDKDAHIFSISLGWPNPDETTRLAFRNAMINVLEAGVVAIVAAGNERTLLGIYPVPQNIRTPGDCPPPWLHPDQTNTGGTSSVICIGATDINDNIGIMSSKGPVTWQAVSPFNDYPFDPEMGLIRPDVCAPGVNIKSCLWNNNSGYQIMSGTSMAAPCVAGVAALMLSKNPYLTPAEICEILETTAVRLPDPSSPKDNSFGSGRIDAYEAIAAVPLPKIICDPASNLSYTQEDNKIVTLTWNRPKNDADLKGYNIYVNEVLVEEMFSEEVFIFLGTEENEYKFCISAVHQNDSASCESKFVCVTFFYDKIEDHKSILKIYPNPSNSIINVEGMNIEKVTVINSIGQVVKTVPFTHDAIYIDVSHFAAGNYVFCASYYDGSIENVKIVIK
jgi:subtilisin family serine protease